MIEVEFSMRAIREARQAHSRFVLGCRRPETVEGERAYQRWRKRVQRGTA